MTLPITPAVGGFSFAFWMIKKNPVNNARIFDWQDSGPTNGFTVLELANSKISTTLRNGASVVGDLNSKAKQNMRLFHYAVTFDGTVLKTYENGEYVNQDTSSAIVAAAAVLTVGRRSGGGNQWNGWMGELVFHNTPTAWSADQVKKLYCSGQIPSGASYWDFNGDVLDKSGNGKHGTLTGGTFVNNDKPRKNPRFMNGSSFFDGAASRIQFPFTPNVAGMTIAVRARLLQGVANGSVIFGWESAADRNGFTIKVDTAAGLFLSVGSNAAAPLSILFNNANKYVIGKWYDLAFTYDGSTHNFYIDSKLVATLSGITITTNGTNPTLGSRSYSATGLCKCFVSEFLYANAALTQKELFDFFKYSKLPVSAQNYYELDDIGTNFLDSIGTAHGTGASVTNVQAAVSVPRVMQTNDKASLYFATTNDVITHSNLGGTVGDTFSTIIREKMKSAGLTLEARVWNKGVDLIRTTSTGTLSVTLNSITATSTKPVFLFDKKWHEYAFTHDGTTFTCYRDGMLIESFALVATASDTASPFTIGNRSSFSRSIDGWLKTFRHFKNRVLTHKEIRDIYFAKDFSSRTGLLIELLLNEGTGATATDTSGNGLNGTISGATWSYNTASFPRLLPGKQYLPTPQMDVDGGSGLPAGWSHYDDGGGSTIVNTIDRSDFVTGTGSHKMTLFNGVSTYKNNWTQIVDLDIPRLLKKFGSTFVITARFKQSAGTQSLFTISGSGIANKSYITSGAVGWTVFTKKIQIEKTVGSLVLSIKLQNTNLVDTATLWVDEITLYPVKRTLPS